MCPVNAVQWLKRLRAGGEPVDHDAWDHLCKLSPLVAELSPDRCERLRVLTGAFLGEKRFEGAHGLEVDDETRLLIAAHACIPLLGLALDWIDDWQTVILYPGDFVAHREIVDEDGVVHESDDALSGEAWNVGPVILSLERAREDARGIHVGNVVIHEIAHKLDMRNGVANGMPPLHIDMSRERWTESWSAAYAELEELFDRGGEPWVDEQALENPGEFFAIMTEMFFTCPGELRRRHGDVYAELRLFYRQDPLDPVESR